MQTQTTDPSSNQTKNPTINQDIAHFFGNKEEWHLQRYVIPLYNVNGEENQQLVQFDSKLGQRGQSIELNSEKSSMRMEPQKVPMTMGGSGGRLRRDSLAMMKDAKRLSK